MGNGTGDMPQTELHLMDKNISERIPALTDWVSSLGKPLLWEYFCWRCCLPWSAILLVACSMAALYNL